jgi:hypothetical protein
MAQNLCFVIYGNPESRSLDVYGPAETILPNKIRSIKRLRKLEKLYNDNLPINAFTSTC